MTDARQGPQWSSGLTDRDRLHDHDGVVSPPMLSVAHIIDATDGPLAGQEARNRVLPFAITAAVSLAVSVPATTWYRPALATAVAAVGAVTLATSFAIPWRRVARSAQLTLPFAFLTATVLLMAAARQDVHSPFVSLLVLPLMWLALYESRFAVLAAAALAGAGLGFVQLTAASNAPSTGLESILVLVICCAGMGVTLHSLVADARALAAALRDHQFALEYQSLHDPLTDVYNRRGFTENARISHYRAVAENRPFSLVYIDLDHFKQLNDTLGHDAGDLLLEEAAERLRRLVRAGDTVARLGGDEFAVLAEGSDPTRSVNLANRIDTALRQPYLAAPNLAVSASVGVAHSADFGGDPDAALSAADRSMFMRKGKRQPLGPLLAKHGRPNSLGAPPPASRFCSEQRTGSDD
jgi:diguanylate cyclase (GGDEF)-like protein